MFTPKDDGVTHINVYSKARTGIGLKLSNFYSSPTGIYYRTPHGPFKTLEGYYHYLRILDMINLCNLNTTVELLCPDIQQLKDADGAVAIKVGRRIKNSVFSTYNHRPKEPTHEFTVFFTIALINKLGTDNIGVELGEVIAKGLPLTHYYHYPANDSVVVPPSGRWLTDLLKTIGDNIDPNGISVSWEQVLSDTLAVLN